LPWAKSAEQLTRLQKWRAILSRAFQAFLNGRLLRGAALARANLMQPERAKSRNPAASRPSTAVFRINVVGSGANIAPEANEERFNVQQQSWRFARAACQGRRAEPQEHRLGEVRG